MDRHIELREDKAARNVTSLVGDRTSSSARERNNLASLQFVATNKNTALVYGTKLRRVAVPVGRYYQPS